MLHLKMFYRETSLAGFAEIAKRTPFLDKFVWVISVTICCLLSIYSITSTLIKFNDGPTIKSVLFGELEHAVYIPAITFCSENPQNETRLNQVVHRLWGQNRNENFSYYKNFLRNITNFSYRNIEAFSLDHDDGTLPQDGYYKLTNEVKEDILIFADTTSDIYLDKWSTVISDFGLCMCWGCAYRLPEDLRNGSLSNSEHDDFLIEIVMKQSAEVLFINLKENNKVYVHKPTEPPNYDHPDCIIKGFYTNLIQEIIITKEDESIKALDISKRNCLFHNENNLKMFGTYSYRGCLMECRYNLAIKLCGCSPHVYPKTDEKTCTLAGLQCLARYKDMFLNPRNVENFECNCLPLCGDIEQRNFMNLMSQEYENSSGHFMKFQHSHLKPVVYYHTVVFSTFDLLVAFGGTASLFLGFSFLSAIEFVYYFTVRQIVSWLKMIFVCISKKRKMKPKPERKAIRQANVEPSLLDLLKESLTQWCRMTSVHGLKYIVHPQRHLVERLLWLIIFLVFLITCIRTTMNVSDSFYKNAVMIETHISQKELDFQRPAISVCNRHFYINKSAFREFGYEHYSAMSYYFTAMMYPSQMFHSINTYMDSTYCINNSRCPPLEQSVNELYKKSRSLSHQKFRCIQLDLSGMNPTSCFVPQQFDSETGPCHIFFSSQIRSFDRNLTKFKRGWKFSLGYRSDEFYEIYIHSPKDVPTTEMLSYNHVVESQTVIKTILRPLETIADDDLRELLPEKRGCRFADENILFLHLQYSYTACIVECRSATMFRLCGCVHPMSPKIQNAKICSHVGIKCLEAHVIDLLTLRGRDGEPHRCGCLPNCDSTNFQLVNLEETRLYKHATYTITFIKPRELNKMRIMQGQIEHVDKFCNCL